MSENAPEAVRNSRIKFLTLVSIAFVPIFVAYAAFFYFPALAPTGTTNQGTLVSPPLSAEEVSGELSGLGSWTLIQPIRGQCDNPCSEMLYLSRQVVTGLGKDTPRMTRAVIVDGVLPASLEALLEAEHPDVIVIRSNSLGVLDKVDSDSPLLFLMDPNANIMMFYRLEQAGKPMLKDLKHLLRVSNIG